MLKEKENPPISWPAGAGISSFVGTWWVAHTKSRNEKAAAWELSRKDISYFLPMRPHIHYIRKRKIRSLLPLFPGYIFFCGRENQRLDLLKTNRVANLIEVKDQPKLLGELLKIEQAINSGVVIAPHKYIEAGRLCRVISGPLAGLQGIVVETRTAARLLLQVDMLGQAASVEIDMDVIEVIDQGSQ